MVYGTLANDRADRVSAASQVGGVDAVIRKFLVDDTGAATAKFTLFASFIVLLIYGWFHTAGVMLHDMTTLVTSTMVAAIRGMTGGTLGL
jgi:Flp pilus assembly pilin Flp